jgi:Xaa-Pro aminopeptidase
VVTRSAVRALSALRAKKSPAELDRLRRATYLSAEAHRQAMQATEPGMNEFEVRALVEYFFLRNGGDGPAYASIVGSGPNSTTLHYNADNRCMNNGEVLLFDVAAYYAGYASDVTRTIPINGTFTPEQRGVYEVVLAAQKAAEQKIRRGARWQDLNEAASLELAKGLARLGLIDAPEATYDCGNAARPNRCPQLRLFYMHGLGHGVGLEVHDPDISTNAGFQPGSAVTIEPGIYVRADAFDYLPDTPDNRAMIQRLRPQLTRYANTGVRIEDVYIFDENGVERASRGAPREIAEIEALM